MISGDRIKDVGLNIYLNFEAFGVIYEILTVINFYFHRSGETLRAYLDIYIKRRLLNLINRTNLYHPNIRHGDPSNEAINLVQGILTLFAGRLVFYYIDV